MSAHVELRQLRQKENPTQDDVKLAFDLAKKIGTLDARVAYSKIKRLVEESTED